MISSAAFPLQNASWPGLLAGKVALVTGAASGIGRAMALLCAQHGASVIVADINPPEGERVVAELAAAGSRGIYVQCDVTDPATIEDMVKRAVEDFGRLLKGMMRCMRAEIPQMLKNGGGAIVNTASIYGIISSAEPFRPAYTASKHAIIGLTKAVALRYARHNIRVNAVCPGPTETAMTKRLLDRGPEARIRIEATVPIGRIARPQEIAEVATWLASDKSSFVTGHALVADGGFVVQ
jgi:NAD(P)-dependent dehydrogenase (short-subunit alcohol dehydrogenase family)